MANVTIRVQGLNTALQALDSEIITGPARNLLTRAGKSVEDKAREYAPVDRGGLKDSIKAIVDSANMPRYVEVGSNLEYARATELGRPPGKMPPVDLINAWALRKGLKPVPRVNADGSPGKTPPQESVGWAIAMHIRDNGNEAKPYLMPALNDTKPKIPRLVATMAREIEAAAAARGGGA